MARLSDVCNIQAGGTPSRSYVEYWKDGNIPWVKISDIKGKKLYITEEKITELGLEKSSAKLFPKGTILYSIFATLGEVAILDIDATTNQAIAGLQLIDDSVLPDYLYYFLVSKKDFVNNIGRGVAQNNINLKILRDMAITIPSKKEQKDIILRLNTINQSIEWRKQQLSKLDELVKARFVELFGDPVINEKGWETKSLLEMGYCKNGMNFRYGDTGIEVNCLGVGDFKDYSIISDTSVLPKVSLNEMPSDDYMLKDNDIVFVRSNGNKALVGRSVVVYPGKVPTTFSGFCIRYRKTDEVVNVPYLVRVLKTESIRKKMAGRGANIQNLNQQILGTLIIPVPPIELQNEFATFVQQVDKSKFEVQQSLEKLETLKKSLMQQYFG